MTVDQGLSASPNAGGEDTGNGTLSWSRTSDLRRMKTLLSRLSYQGMWRSRQDLNLQLDFSEHSLSERADYQLSHDSVSQSPRTGPRILSTKKGRKISPNLDWSWWTDLNPRPTDYKSAALPTELHQHICGRGRFSLPLWENRRFVARTGSNRRPSACKADALPTALYPQINQGAVCCYTKGILVIYVLPRPCDCSCTGSNASQNNLYNRLIVAFVLD